MPQLIHLKVAFLKVNSWSNYWGVVCLIYEQLNKTKILILDTNILTKISVFSLSEMSVNQRNCFNIWLLLWYPMKIVAEKNWK